MCLLSATPVRQSRTIHYCADCERPITGPHIRLYGRAHSPDPFHTLRVHVDCCKWEHPKILAAKAKLEPAPAHD